MNRDGELDGLVLAEDAGALELVHFPPHMAGDVEAAIKFGDHIAVHGVRPRGTKLGVADFAVICAAWLPISLNAPVIGQESLRAASEMPG